MAIREIVTLESHPDILMAGAAGHGKPKAEARSPQ